MDDRELLELAAKAAGYEVWAGRGHQEDMFFVRMEKPDPTGKCSGREWNPLNDDGDALRLAAGLCLNVLSSEACVVVEDEKGVECIEYFYGPEDYTSGWRRAIVRAAAEIGKVANE